MSRTKEALRKAKRLLKKRAGSLKPVDLDSMVCPQWLTRAYKNNRYVVIIDDNARMTMGVTAIRAMIQRHDDMPIPRHWAEIQKIKNAIFGEETVAIEYYPAQSQLIDKANVYWIWILPKEVLPVFYPAPSTKAPIKEVKPCL